MGAHVKSYRRQQQKILAFAAIICIFIIALNLAAVLKPYFRRPPISKFVFFILNFDVNW